ncbi:HAD family hydrolase [Pseudobacteriovorax antillogorgiicola]|uniref:phosphoglycolate phosphatase n=1 Tax=Pseudobacteriovorax antillogorgiicola TaxID=1513793 RepID=A0A1Y6B784_9BACT|nr:HAD family hydrolase [Pseudobacteriovorax antillogorgiicola]TCS58623.1 FMN phosphatase YigB (HAD superfamily) [Pseudobacteriovorax antillogorgiicola]SME96699.1 FMN phosphatase YigB, HAD superfamily [Pseudobacteriovorax antillogorgiicola]
MTRKYEKLLVLDIDNTVFDWVSYYVACLNELFSKVEDITGVPVAQQALESKKVFEEQGSIEYPFLIQELPSIAAHYQGDIDRMLSEAVEPGRLAFKDMAQKHLTAYDGVLETFKTIKDRWPHFPIIALTDAPRYVAMWKLNKLGILHYFDALYGLSDPRIPTDPESKKVKVAPEILYKHLQQSAFDFKGIVRTLPEDYEKPGTRGLKTVLMDHDMEGHFDHVLWVGDNLRKDVGLGRSLGVRTAWARYGTQIEPEIKDALLQFSPELNVHKNVSLDPKSDASPEPDVILDSFSELVAAIDKLI